MKPTQPDWESLADINFLVRRRLVEHLNAAIGAVNLVDTPEAGGKPADFWKGHAIRHIMRAQHLYEAWSMLIRYKSGQRMTHTRQFRAGDLLEGLASETFQTYVPHVDHERILEGNRETLQEALFLIHSAAYGLGPNVRLLTDFRDGGFWFRVRYHDSRHQTRTLTELLDMLGDDWRTANTGFELHRAKDFLEMNDCALSFSWRENQGELAFFVPAVGAVRPSPATLALAGHDTTSAAPDALTAAETLLAATASNTEDETQPSAEDIRRRFSKRIQANYSSTENSSRSDG